MYNYLFKDTIEYPITPSQVPEGITFPLKSVEKETFYLIESGYATYLNIDLAAAILSSTNKIIVR